MRQFSNRGFRLKHAQFETKLVYSFFLVFIALGFVTIALFQSKAIGFAFNAIQAHYRGDEATLQFPKSFLHLLEISHAHAFIMGIVYLTLAHLFLATDLSEQWKRRWLVIGFASTLLDILLPWGIRYLSAELSYLLLIVWVGQWLSYGAFMLWPLYEMWGPAPEARD